MNDPIVGIDLGTSNSVVGYADVAGTVKVLADDSGAKLQPSVVSFHPNGGVVIGAAAKQRKVIDPQNTIYSVKRLIGRSYRSPEVQTAKTRSPFLIKEGQNSAPIIATRAGEFAVPEISAIVLDHVRNIASARLDCQVNRAVVTVPAAFNDAQRSATATAGAIAGLTVVRVLNEPTAAALAYGHSRQLREIIAVYDFGGGTFDITILKLEDQVYEVLGTSGDTFLGGDDLDERLVDKMVAKFLAENRIDLRTNEVSMMRLRAVAEQTKIELSRRSRAVVRVDEIAYGARGAPLNLQIEITRDEFVKEVSDIVDRTFPVCTEALALANLSIDQIADVILVGGTTKIPYVRDQVGRYFGKLPRADVNPEDAVAAGAALQALALDRILSRRASAATTATDAPEEVTAVSGNAHEPEQPGDRSGATMAPSELMLTARERPRPTAGYGSHAHRPASEPTKPDTSYSVTRPGVRDQVADPQRYPTPPPSPAASASPPQVAAAAASLERTPVPAMQTQPLGRITRPVAAVPPSPPLPPPIPSPSLPPPIPSPPVASPARTLVGPPAAPIQRRGEFEAGGPAGFAGAPGGPVPRESAVEVDLSSAGIAVGGPPPLPPPRSAPALGTATPPPLPPPFVRPPGGRHPTRTTAQLLPHHKAPDPRRPRAPVQDQAPLSGFIEDPDTREITHSREAAEAADAYTTPDGYPSPEPPDWTSMDSSAGTNPAAWLLTEPSIALELPASAPPLVEVGPDDSVPVRGPHAPTMLDPAGPSRGAARAAGGQIGRGSAPPNLESGLATTDRGFHAPQSFPVQSFAAPPRPAPVLLEVTPRGLGIATVAGFCEELIRRNVRLPAETKRLFTTSRDQQDLVRIVVCQGESRRLDKNTIIGDLVLQNLPPRPRGETSIEVTFSLDAAGLLDVRARDAQTGAEQRATLDLVGDVAQDDVAVSRDRLQQLRR